MGGPPHAADIAYGGDQSHNLKNKVEAMIQTVMTAQLLFAKAALIDHEALQKARTEQRLIDAETAIRTLTKRIVVRFCGSGARATGLRRIRCKLFGPADTRSALPANVVFAKRGLPATPDRLQFDSEATAAYTGEA